MHRVWFLTVAALAALSRTHDGIQEPPADPGIAIVGVNLVPMDSPVVLADHTVHVRGDRIAWVGPSAEAPLPEGVRVIEGRGLYLMPGLADMHVHAWRDADLPLFVAYGVTTVRNMFGDPIQLDMRRRIAAGALVGPTIVTAGPIIDGDPPVWQGSTVATTPNDAARAVREQKERGYDFIKVYIRLSRPVYDAILREAETLGMPVAGHVPAEVGLDAVLAGTQMSIEHLDQYASMLQSDPTLLGDTSLSWSGWLTVDATLMPDLARRSLESGITNVPTLVLWEKLGLENPESELSRPEARYVSPELVDIWRQLAVAPDRAAVLRGGQAQRKAMTGALREAGAPLLLGTDVGNPYIIPGFSAHEELSLLVASGLEPFEALAAATRNAAAFLGQSAEFGVIAEGRRADLLLVEGNPLEDVANVSRRAGVMLRGRWLSRADLDAMLEELARSFTR